MISARNMLPLWCAAALISGTARAGTIVVDERALAVLLVVTPRGADPSTRTAEILRTASDALESRTDLKLQSAEQAGSDLRRVDRCADQARLSCWVRAVRPDYDRLALELGNGQVQPYAEHVSAMKRRGVPYPRFLLVVTIFPRPDQPDQLTALLINTDVALTQYHEASRRRGDWLETVEGRIFEQAVQSRPGFARVADTEQLSGYFESIFDGALRGAFERSGHWAPFGSIELKAPAGLIVALDGAVVGTTSGEATTLQGVQPGQRVVGVSDPEGALSPFRADVRVGRGATARVVPQLTRRVSSFVSTTQRAAFWSGVGVAALGAGFAAYGLLADPQFEVVQPCIAGRCPSASRRFVSFCELSADRADDCNPAGGGVLVVPVGYSLIATGGLWTLGTALWSDEHELPWLPLVVGVVAGAASYGLSVALDG